MDGQITVVPICLSCLAGAILILHVLASKPLSAEGILKPPIWCVPWVALEVTEFCVVNPPHSDTLDWVWMQGKTFTASVSAVGLPWQMSLIQHGRWTEPAQLRTRHWEFVYPTLYHMLQTVPYGNRWAGTSLFHKGACVSAMGRQPHVCIVTYLLSRGTVAVRSHCSRAWLHVQAVVFIHSSFAPSLAC